MSRRANPTNRCHDEMYNIKQTFDLYHEVYLIHIYLNHIAQLR
jgi:hypothetical protein